MTTEMTAVEEIESFLESWQGDDQPMREWYRKFYQELRAIPGVSFVFVGRPGVSYSIRPVHENQTERDKFAIMDVIDDDPEERWLSICFYEDMITDPNERGELIPGGLGGSDGYCFDMYDDDKDMAGELLDRLKEAAASAAG